MDAAGAQPSFVQRGGELVIRAPLVLERARFRGFLLEGDRDQIQAMADRVFNGPSHGALDLKPISRLVVLSFTNVPRAYSTHARDHQIGWVEETDVAFWVPLLSRRHGRPHLSWYIPYIFVDNPFAMATGREGYGFPKTMGRFEMPDDSRCPGRYSVDTLVWDRYSPDTPAHQRRLLEVTPRPDLAAGSRLKTALDALGNVLALLGNDLEADLENARAELANLVFGKHVPMIFLRQLRDVRDPDRAAYQEIVEAPARVLRLHGGGLMPHAYEVRVASTASHPIAEELGLRPEGQVARASFWADFDFLTDTGERLWSTVAEPTPTPNDATRRNDAVATTTG